MYIHVHISMHIYVDSYTYRSMCISVDISRQFWDDRCTDMFVYIYIYIYTYTYIHTRIDLCTYM